MVSCLLLSSIQPSQQGSGLEDQYNSPPAYTILRLIHRGQFHPMGSLFPSQPGGTAGKLRSDWLPRTFSLGSRF